MYVNKIFEADLLLQQLISSCSKKQGVLVKQNIKTHHSFWRSILDTGIIPTFLLRVDLLIWFGTFC